MKYADDYSGYGNSVLYAMCKERPLHNDVDTIRSKLWLIGRAYSAAIERKAGKEFNIDKLASLLKESELDEHIKKLASIQRLTLQNINILLSAHKYLTDLFNQTTKLKKRSLASKYLHFHAPQAVFIFDSIANKKIRNILSATKIRFKVEGSHDYQYEAFVRRCLHFRDEIYENEIGALATPRKIDTHLYPQGD